MSYDIGSTHIPVLIALGLSRPIRHVLELGAGLYSTPTFLDWRVFPRLEQLVSFEDNQEWRNRVALKCPDDRLLITDEFPNLEKQYDLIFVDNATDLAVRAATIRKVCDETRDVLVVIHDAEDVNYIPEINRFEWHQTIKTYNKWTALAFNGRVDGVFDSSMRLLIEHNSHLAPTDINGWFEVLSR